MKNTVKKKRKSREKDRKFWKKKEKILGMKWKKEWRVSKEYGERKK